MSEDRKFGFVVGGACGLIGGGLVLAGSRPAGAGLLGAATLLVVLGAAAPRFLSGVHRAWRLLAGFLARVNTALLLGVVYFLVLTPLGLALRLLGRDELARRSRPATGWVPYPGRNRDPRHYEKMF